MVDMEPFNRDESFFNLETLRLNRSYVELAVEAHHLGVNENGKTVLETAADYQAFAEK